MGSSERKINSAYWVSNTCGRNSRARSNNRCRANSKWKPDAFSSITANHQCERQFVTHPTCDIARNRISIEERFGFKDSNQRFATSWIRRCARVGLRRMIERFKNESRVPPETSFNQRVPAAPLNSPDCDISSLGL